MSEFNKVICAIAGAIWGAVVMHAIHIPFLPTHVVMVVALFLGLLLGVVSMFVCDLRRQKIRKALESVAKKTALPFPDDMQPTFRAIAGHRPNHYLGDLEFDIDGLRREIRDLLQETTAMFGDGRATPVGRIGECVIYLSMAKKPYDWSRFLLKYDRHGQHGLIYTPPAIIEQVKKHYGI